MHSIWNFLLERKAFTILTIVSLTLAGVYTILAIPKESSPEVIIPMGIVSTVLPGATSEEVESLVTDKLEPYVRNLSGIDKVTSTSKSGVSVIVAQFDSSVDIDSALQDLRNAVDGAKGELPSEAEDPFVSEMNFSDQPIMVVAISSDISPTTLSSLGDTLKEELGGVSGVSKVQIAGTREREISVIVHKEALAARGLRVEQVIAALRSSNVMIPSGSITVNDVDYPVRLIGDVRTADEIRAVRVASQAGDVAISDIAHVIDGYKTSETIARLGGKSTESGYAFTLSIYKSSGGNIMDITSGVRTRLAELESGVLKGSNSVVVFDAGKDIAKDLSELSRVGLETVFLITIVLFVTIGFREALIAAISVPLSFVLAFIGLYATDNTINFISLFSLILAIGILVDSGIVVVEAIHTHREKGYSKLDAARAAIKMYAWPLIAGTMTTVAVFVPLFFLSGVVGQFISSIPYTIIIVLMASIFVALGWVPILATLFSAKVHGASRFAARREELWKRLGAWYREVMLKLFARRRMQNTFIVGVVAAMVISFVLVFVGVVKSVFFPPADTSRIYVGIEMPQGSTLSDTDKVSKDVESILANNHYVQSYIATVGQSSTFTAGGDVSHKYANFTLVLREDRDSKGGESSMEIADIIRQDLREANAGGGIAKVSVDEESSGPPSGAPVVVKVFSDDTKTLASVTDQLERIMREVEGARDVASSLRHDATGIDISLNRDMLVDYGLTASDVAGMLRIAVSGVSATTLRVDGEDIDVRVTLDLNKEYINPEDTTITNMAAIQDIPIVTQRGIVRLGQLTNTQADRASMSISHEEGDRIATIESYVKDTSTALDITNAFREKASALNLPAGVRIEYGGDDEDIKKTFTEMIVALVAGITFMFGILVLEFNAFRTSFRLLTIVPLSLTGVLVGLAIMQQPLSFTALLGVVALAGVIINHGIILIDGMKHIEEENPNASAVEIALGAAEIRFRPILLTTITTVIGMIPLTQASEMWAPLAYSVAFGLLYSAILTLVYIPVMSYRHLKKKESKQ